MTIAKCCKKKCMCLRIVLHQYLFYFNLFLVYIWANTNMEILFILRHYCKMGQKAAEASRKI